MAVYGCDILFKFLKGHRNKFTVQIYYRLTVCCLYVIQISTYQCRLLRKGMLCSAICSAR